MAETSYKNIFKTTFLFGFVTVARLLVSLVKNKVIAVLIGPQGVGIFSVFTNTTNMVKTGAGLGISQSAVKDVSEANNTGDYDKISQSINVTQKVVVFTSSLGLVLTIVLSPFLSKWGFGDYAHIGAFLLLSVSIFFEIYVENQLAILKGMRRLRAIAKVSLIGSITALIVGVPFIYLWGEDGIVPSLIASSLSVFLFSIYYVSRIDYNKTKIGLKELFLKASSMVKMGTAMMMSSFLFYFSNLIIIGYIQSIGGLEDVGFYNAGTVLAVTYISLVTSSMNTDYYPRIAAINSDNKGISSEIYKQSVISLMLLLPLIVIFVLIMPFIIRLLYTSDFVVVTSYIDIAIIGVLASVVTNCFGYVFMAKQETKFYFVTSVIFSIASIPIYMLLYRGLGLFGLGLSYTINVLIQLAVYVFFCWKKYSIHINNSIFFELLASAILITLAAVIRKSHSSYLFFLGGTALLVVSILYVNLNLKYRIGFDIVDRVRRRINKR